MKVKAPPEKGRANEAVVALVADRLGIDTSSIWMVSGHGRDWTGDTRLMNATSDGQKTSGFPRGKPTERYCRVPCKGLHNLPHNCHFSRYSRASKNWIQYSPSTPSPRRLPPRREHEAEGARDFR